VTEKRGFRVGWLLTLAILLATLSIGVGDRVLRHWAYSLERGKLLAAADDLADAETVSNAFRLVAKIAQPGVVRIQVAGTTPERTKELEDRFRQWLGDEADPEQLRDFLRRHREAPVSGSGILLDEKGHILTNGHVVADREDFTVQLFDDRAYSARLVGTDPKTDLAVLKIDATDLHPLKFGDSDAMEVGDWVLAVGAPFGLSQTVTHGIVSAKGRTEVPGVNISYQDFIQTDAAINPGNSGGPLMNLRGQVVGVNTAIATNGDSYNAGIAFTIPSNMARRVSDQLITNGRVDRGWLGIRMAELSPEDFDTLGIDRQSGVMVDVVFEDMPAFRAGVLVEDLVTAINGTPVQDMHQFRGIIADIMPGEQAKLRLQRDGKELDLNVRLGRQPEIVNDRSLSRPIATRSIGALGVEVRSLRSELIRTLLRSGSQIAEDVRGGVLVIDAESPGALQRADVQAGDVVIECDGRRIRSVSDLSQALGRASSREKVELRVMNRSGESRTVEVHPRRSP
jgi:serine protease Do